MMYTVTQTFTGPALLDTPAAVRFISAEPLLGPVDLTPWLNPDTACEHCAAPCAGCPWDKAVVRDEDFNETTGHQPFRRLDWVIAGGESGPGSRPMHPSWARSLRDQCQASGVAFHFKQWGAWAPAEPGGWYSQTVRVRQDGTTYSPVQRTEAAADAYMYAPRSKNLRELDGCTWDEYPGGAS